MRCDLPSLTATADCRTLRHQDWTLDATGNQTAVESSWYQNTANKANEYTARTIKGGDNKEPVSDD